MQKGITLNAFISELQKLQAEHGNDSITSIGAASGNIMGLASPFCLHFEGSDAVKFVPAYQEDVRHAAKEALVADNDLRTVWMRLGVSMNITKEEEEALFVGNAQAGAKAIYRILEEGRAVLDGDAYIPDVCIEDFDEKYGTNYRECDEERGWCLDGDKLHGPIFGKALSVAERIREIEGLEVSRDAKKELIVSSFGTGQEYFEKDTERFIALKAKGPFDVWVFDVFDKNKEHLYETTEFAARLANDILSGYVVPASMMQEKSVSEIISDAAGRSEREGSKESKEQDYSKE